MFKDLKDFLVSAYYFENKEKKLILSGYNWSKTKFSGTSIKVPQEGLNIVHDVKHNEHYEIVQPTVVVGGILLGKLQWEFVGPCKITCKETGFYAEIDFKSKVRKFELFYIRYTRGHNSLLFKVNSNSFRGRSFRYL